MPKKIKSIADRARIVDKIKDQFQQLLGTNIDDFDSEGLRTFNGILEEYATKEQLTSGFSGRIYVHEFDRYLDYVLPLSLHAVEKVILKTM